MLLLAPELSGYASACQQTLHLSFHSVLANMVRYTGVHQLYRLQYRLLLLPSWLPPLDGNNWCTAVCQLYYLYIKYKGLRLL